MKRIGLVHIGDRITSDINKIVNYNLISFCNILSEENVVFLYTAILKKDNFKQFENNNFQVRDIFKKEVDDLDELIFYTSDVNFQGGADKPVVLMGYWFLNKFVKKDKPVWYFNNDLSYYLKDTREIVKNRSWKDKYPLEDFGIDGLKIRILHQYKNPEIIEKFKEMNSKLGAELVSCDFINFSLVNSAFMETVKYRHKDERTTDLVYYGFHRYGKRTDEMHRYFYNVPNTDVYGTIDKYKERLSKKDNEIIPNFHGKLDRKKLFQTISNSLATVIISDEDYKKYCNIPTRFYEAINTGLITFISEGTDSMNEFFPEEFSSFLRVTSSEDVRQKIDEIKEWSNEKLQEFLVEQKRNAYINYDSRKKEVLETFDKYD